MLYSLHCFNPYLHMLIAFIAETLLVGGYGIRGSRGSGREIESMDSSCVDTRNGTFPIHLYTSMLRYPLKC